MKKMFYSEVLDKYFDNEEECLRAELVKKQEDYKVQEAKKSDLRKKLSDAIEAAEEAVDVAAQELANVAEKAEEAYNKAVQPYREKLQEAQRARLDAIESFNKQFGMYHKVLTGEAAEKELLRMAKDYVNMFNF